MTRDFLSLAAPGVRTLQPYQPGKPESELRREYGLSDIVKLASNENPLGPSPRALAAIREALSGLARYPDGNGFELKAALSAKLGLSTATLTLGNGSNDVLELAARAFLTPEHEAVFSEHAFAVYPIVTQAIGATARVARANPPDHAMPYGHDPAALLASINDRTRLVFVANPNNPTGTWLKTAELEAFLKAIPERVIVVVDEAYFEYVEAEADCPNALCWLDRFPNLIVTRTFSKALVWPGCGSAMRSRIPRWRICSTGSASRSTSTAWRWSRRRRRWTTSGIWSGAVRSTGPEWSSCETPAANWG